jgi:hypothetical protein
MDYVDERSFPGAEQDSFPGQQPAPNEGYEPGYSSRLTASEHSRSDPYGSGSDEADDEDLIRHMVRPDCLTDEDEHDFEVEYDHEDE